MAEDMRKILIKHNAIILTILALMFFLIPPIKVYSGLTQPEFNKYIWTGTTNCPYVEIKYTPGVVSYPQIGHTNAEELTYTVNVKETNLSYKIHDEFNFVQSDYSVILNPPITNPITNTVTNEDIIDFGKHELYVEYKTANGSWENYCGPFSYEIIEVTPTPIPTTPPKFTCSYKIKSDNDNPELFTKFDTLKIVDGILTPNSEPVPILKEVGAQIYQYPNGNFVTVEYWPVTYSGNRILFEGTLGTAFPVGQYKVIIISNTGSRSDSQSERCELKIFTVCESGEIGCGVLTPTPLPPCSSPYSCIRDGCSFPNTPAIPDTVGYGDCSYYEESCCLAPTPTNPDYCYSKPCTNDEGGDRHDCSVPNCQACNFCRPSAPAILTNTPFPPLPDLVKLCDQLPTSSEPKQDFQRKCKACVEPPDGHGGMWTAIGCLPVGGLEVFLKDYLFVFGIGIAGGIAFLYFLYGTFLFLTSAGNAETVAQAKEIIVSALSGLLFIIFSILLLKIVGGDILRIPGFGP